MVRSLDEIRDDVRDVFRVYNDFPKPGIIFRDVLPLMSKPALLNELCASIAEHAKQIGATAVAGLEARVAIHAGIPFVPLRKKGKLPGEVRSVSYAKEYGTDVIEVQKDALKAGAKVLIIDDLLATGGTLKGAIQLVGESGAEVVEAFVVAELSYLNGRQKIGGVVPLKALLTFDS